VRRLVHAKRTSNLWLEHTPEYAALAKMVDRKSTEALAEAKPRVPSREEIRALLQNLGTFMDECAVDRDIEADIITLQEFIRNL